MGFEKMDAWQLVKGFEPVSLCDWPAKISCVIFIGGCNFRCPTCHNKSIAFYPEKISSIPKEDILEYLVQKRGWIDGVVITGGEPTCASGLDFLIKEIKDLGYLVKLDTNGSNPELIEDFLIRDLVDVFAVDVKGPFEKYEILTGNRITQEKIRKF
jgi:pyruvate formate lyase activating enzyme